MPFTQKALDFLFENCLNDSKHWFEERRDEYRKLVTQPFSELAEELAPLFAEIDGGIICTPKRISRVYRDTRFSNDKRMFRDHIWLNISRPKRDRFDEPPGFYVCIAQTGLEYGCGFYSAASGLMREMRELILNNDKCAVDAIKAYNAQNIFELGGDMYKRSRFPDEPEEKRLWLERKNIFLFRNDSREAMADPKLAERLKNDFPKIAPVYLMLLKAYQAGGDAPAGNSRR